MMSLQSWPEPIVRVQSLSDSGINAIPERYIKGASDRPSLHHTFSTEVNIPIIDFQNLFSNETSIRDETLTLMSRACRAWGFFQVVNHGISHDLMKGAREAWREFFHLPVKAKQVYANSPVTYEGYGSRLGVEKGAKLDWSDYFFLNYLPASGRDKNKWPISCRKLVNEYGDELGKLCGKLMKVFAVNLGLGEDCLQKAVGGEEAAASMRVNFYPKCPQPDLTLGLSSHSDPGVITLLLPDENVRGLQVRRGDAWLTVKPVPNAFIVNIGDQMQVLTNAIYKSVEHRVIVNSMKERVSIAFFYNPKGDKVIEPVKELVTEDRPAMYQPMTFNEYRMVIRTKGPCGKSQVEALKSS
ncbi:jasmonate-induced oxygenase 2-like [Cornus florida]|uniref:jasmonate-induced oxygenase 2-like n=1 Tax=Cornus florida TaxID=4283 RepID=UPI00289C9283|nr:jasmonate-induced oxygenase 2-like [Cornus florida]